ncbi:ATP-binding protein [Kitasatospora sp. NPDC048296]|uniref:ATP-binding protein n=1 Tax=Kitasatospora sp. NPDC048296 TaxID=3364048 RepID=UPI00371DF5FC
MTATPAADLVGRDRELGMFRAALADLAAGRGGSLLVEGEPGIGKSSLLTAALDGTGCEVLRGTCDELNRRFPLSVMLETLGVDARSSDPLRAATARALTGAPELRPGDHGWSVAMLAGDPVVAAVEQLLALVDQLCTAGPLVLAVDDLHWADDASLLLWQRLSRATAQLPLFLVGACRPVPRREELDRLRRDLRTRDGLLVSLGPLPIDGVAALAERTIGAAPGPRLAARLESAAGNPLYVHEMLAALTGSAALTVTQEVVDLSAGHHSAEPHHSDHGAHEMSLTGMLAHRLDYLQDSTRALLRTAALLGPDFSVTDLADIVKRSPAALATDLDEAITAGVLESAGTRLRFRHGLLKQALHEATPSALRAALHRQATEALITAGAPVERIAQLLLAEPAGADGWEVAWLAEHAGALHRAPAIAAELFERALRHTAEDDARHALLEDHLVAVSFLLSRHDQTERLARAILGRTVDLHRIGRTTWFLCYTLMRTDRLDDALVLLHDTIAALTSEPCWWALLTALKAILLVGFGQPDTAAEAAAQALAAAEQVGDATARGWALHAQAITCLCRSDNRGGLAFIDRGLAIAGTDPHLAYLRLLLLSNRATALDAVDRTADAVDTLRQARTLAERTGTQMLAVVQIHAGEQAFREGRWDDALTEFEAITDLPGQFLRPLKAHGYRALIAEHRDDPLEAARHLELLRDHPVSATSLARGASGPLLMARALEAERAGDPEQACRILAVVLRPEYEQAMQSRAAWFPPLARFALAAGDEATARATAEAADTEARHEPIPLKRATAQWCRGLVDGDPEPILAAASYHRTTRRPLELGNALEDAAALLAEAGRLDEARTALTEALAAYTTLGATWDPRRATQRLRSHGIRPGVRGPRRRPRTGWDALTPTELRVAELAAQGHSNPDIAERLLLSRRTVETHVSHILTKLHATSRRHIANHTPRRTAPQQPHPGTSWESAQRRGGPLDRAGDFTPAHGMDA